MTECKNERPWDTETPSHKISHHKHYGEQSKTDNITSISRACCNRAFGVHESRQYYKNMLNLNSRIICKLLYKI